MADQKESEKQVRRGLAVLAAAIHNTGRQRTEMETLTTAQIFLDWIETGTPPRSPPRWS